MILKNFIVFEGLDGAGTSTQIALLKKNPLAKKIFFTAEPTERETGKFLRKVLGGKTEVSAEAAAYLFAADRADHLWGKGGILEQTQSGKIVVCDRYVFSSLAYQGVTCGEELPCLLNSPFPLPEILFFFKIKAKSSLLRIEGRGEKKEIYENEKTLFAVARRYEKVISQYEKSGMRIVKIDAEDAKEAVAKKIAAEIGAICNRNSEGN